MVANRFMQEHQGDVAVLCKKAGQYGVGFPGGVDPLVHFRIILEKIALTEGFDEALAILDVDFKNIFKSSHCPNRTTFRPQKDKKGLTTQHWLWLLRKHRLL